MFSRAKVTYLSFFSIFTTEIIVKIWRLFLNPEFLTKKNDNENWNPDFRRRLPRYKCHYPWRVQNCHQSLWDGSNRNS